MKWLFLIHQVHTPNSRERVKVWRAIKKTGAILYRNSVYVLPYSRERLEDLQWVCQQINDSQGEASVFISTAQTRQEEGAIRGLFQKAREAEYGALLLSAERLQAKINSRLRGKRVTDRQARGISREVEQMREALAEICAIDFFSSAPPPRVAEAVQRLDRWNAPVPEMPAAPVRPRSSREYQKKTWATREGIHIDRICSAWLIRRFIDPSARFVFAAEDNLPKNAVPFDIFGAEFGHHGDDCTFETLIKVFRITDSALSSIAQIIHDIDLKDRKFGRTEAAGLDLVIRALSASIKDDHQLLEAGSLILDGLHRLLSKPEGKAGKSSRRGR